jgi:hypothetical protein
MPIETNEVIINMLPLIGVIVGAGLSIAGGFVSTYLLENQKQARESKRLAYAFRGEIRAILQIIDTRKYIQHIEQIIKSMEASGESRTIVIAVRREYFNVYKSNVGYIGILKNPLPESVARLYVQFNSILEDLESNRDSTFKDADVGFLIYSHKELLSLFNDSISLGKSTIDQINKLYP